MHVVSLASCPRHGVQAGTVCYVCNAPLEQVAMVSLTDFRLLQRELEDAVGAVRAVLKCAPPPCADCLTDLLDVDRHGGACLDEIGDPVWRGKERSHG